MSTLSTAPAERSRGLPPTSPAGPMGLARCLAPAVLLLCLSRSVGSAAPTTDWESRQQFQIPTAGLVKVPLPAETLNSARPAMEDLRLLDPAGRETPFLIEDPRAMPPQFVPPSSVQVYVEPERTRIVVRRPPGKQLSGLRLETSSPDFLKSVTVREGSEAGAGRVLAENQPVFRQPGAATRLFIELPDTAAEVLTLLLDDRRTPSIPIDGVRLQEVAEEPPPDEPVAATVRQQLESPGETRLTIDLRAANLTLASLFLDTSEPLFTRSVTLLTREVVGGEVHERGLRSGTVYRVGVEGGESSAQLELPLDVRVAAREVLLRIDNGDSPPLRLEGCRLTRRPVFLVFQAPEAGRFTLLTGNPMAPAPRYDVAALAPRLRSLQPLDLVLGPVQPNPEFQPPALLPTVPLLAGVLDVSDWAFRRSVLGEAEVGVQELELDLDVLARSKANLADLRLMSGDRQVPFLLERTSQQREVALVVETLSDPKRPALSRWKLRLPEKSLPIGRLVFDVPTTLFERRMMLVEEVPDDRGRLLRRGLGEAVWRRTPDRVAGRFWIDLAHPPRSDTLILETDNGDNPGLELASGEALYGVTRILFRLPSAAPVELYYGNPQAGSPSYDLALLAPQILAARRLPAGLGDREQLTGAPWLEDGGGTSGVGTVLFWAVLALVVGGLIFVIVRLLPSADS